MSEVRSLPPRVSRRGFLKRAVGFATVPMILPTGAFGRGATPGANNKIATGHIGLGQRGRALLDGLRDNVAAVCDVDDARMAQGAALTPPGTKTYTDYRDLLLRKDIDAVVIASPDHWHAVHAVHACEAGKDVYLETPVCRSPIAGQKILRAASRYGCVVQTGSLPLQGPAFAALQLALKDAGTVGEIAITGQANPVGGMETQSAPPEALRWEQWLGPAPRRPYSADFVQDGWRWALDFGGGQIMRQGAQLLECAAALLDLSMGARITVSTQGKAPESGVFDCPQPFEATWTFEKPALKITWKQEGVNEGTGAAPEPKLELRGDKASFAAHGVGAQFAVDAALIEKLPEPARTPAASPVGAWLEAAQKRSLGSAPLAHGVMAASLAALANVSFRLGRPLTWDGAQGACSNDELANRLLAEPGFGPWRI